MNLTYRILWIEDDKEYLDSFDTDELMDYIGEQGFDLELEYRTTPEQIREKVDGTRYDLLIIDYNLADGDGQNSDVHGSDVIRQIRAQKCLTEVIFYSQNGPATLRQAAVENELEGIFYSGKKSEQLLRKVQDVFNLTIRKVVDVENMRGIVMAGVADLDHLITDVIRAVHGSLEEGKQVDLCKRLLEKMRPMVKGLKALVKEQDHVHFGEVEKLIDTIVRLDPADFETLVKARSFDSHKRVEMAISLCNDHEHLKEHKNGISSIKDLLKWRNALAHQRPKKIESGYPVFEPLNGIEEAFDEERTRQLRQQLRSQRAALIGMLTALGKGS
jgi:DNA-binding NarL/FixJ family response regulator